LEESQYTGFIGDLAALENMNIIKANKVASKFRNVAFMAKLRLSRFRGKLIELSANLNTVLGEESSQVDFPYQDSSLKVIASIRTDTITFSLLPNRNLYKVSILNTYAAKLKQLWVNHKAIIKLVNKLNISNFSTTLGREENKNCNDFEDLKKAIDRIASSDTLNFDESKYLDWQYDNVPAIGAESHFDLNSNGDKDNFLNDVFCVLSRYDTIEGHGLQAALPHSVMQMLRKHFGVMVECFSSPLNTVTPFYCSAFPDTDIPFGSLGSFFDFFPTSVSFEVNPPFVPAIINQTSSHIDHLLARAAGPMSFVVVIPYWERDPFFQTLVSNVYIRNVTRVPAGQHSYCDGVQHRRNTAEIHRPAPFDTAVIFLQNEEGAKTWTVTEDSVRNVLDAFRFSAEHAVGRVVDAYIPRRMRNAAADDTGE